MKLWVVGFLVAVLLGTTAGTSVCLAADEDVEEDGGTRDTSIRHTRPVVISSTEISSFKLRFQFSGDYDTDELRTRYPSGWYDFRLERTENGALCHLEFWRDGEPSRKADFPVKRDVLKRLDALLK